MPIYPFPLLPTFGTIPPEQIVGRDRDITNLLRLLRSQSVTVEELRRMGKSFLVLKLEWQCNTNTLPQEFHKENFKAKYFSFQGKQNLGEVIDLLMNGLKDFKEWHQIDFQATYSFIRGLLNSPEIETGAMTFSLNLPEYKKSWKDIFFKTLDEIATVQQKQNGKLILIFDELPIMLWEWYKEGKHEDAMELLDILRERRQTLEKNGVRFIYCGSIGIKVVLDTFRKDFKYTGEPTNEMAEFRLEPFSEADCNFLCECFILGGCQVAAADKSNCLHLIYRLSNGLPFYISAIFNLLQTEFDYVVTEDTIKRAYHAILNETIHHRVFNQLIDRLDIYYSAEKSKEMKKLLSYLSTQHDYTDEEQIRDQTGLYDEDSLKKSLYTLYGDHYIIRETSSGKRAYKFKYHIFKEWWKINQA